MKHLIMASIFCILISMLVSCDAAVTGLELSPDSYDYGSTYLGDSQTMYFRVSNTSTTSFTIRSVAILGIDASSFFLTSGGSFPRGLTSGSSMIIGVKFQPTRTGLHNVYLQVSHSGAKGIERVYITGTGQAVARLTVSVNELDFEKTYLARAKVLEIEIQNTGTATLVLNNFSYTYPNVSQFSVKSGGTIPVIMTVGSTHKIEVEFNPDYESTFYNELLIAHNAVDPASPLKIKLTGIGVNFSPEIKFSETSPWDIGLHSTHKPSTQNLVITSDGIDPLTLTSISLKTGTDFSIVEFQNKNGNVINLPQTLQPGDTLTVIIKFAPQATQQYNDTLTIVHDGINEATPYDFEIKGEGRVAIVKTINFTGVVENWTVPAGITLLTVEVWGAQGGNSNNLGGKGAYIKGDIVVSPGDTLKILVGERGKDGSGYPTYDGGGGGGGSFVCKSNNDPLIIAGGGGGYCSYNSATTHDGRSTTDGGDTYNNGGGNSGQGGQSGITNGQASGGGGLLTAGGNGSSGTGGSSFLNGGAGGTGYGSGSYTGGDGGFGGGGGGWHNSINRSGGGGGYSGGQGGTCSGQAAGGGGGSINNGSDQTNTAGIQSGNGKIVITY